MGTQRRSRYEVYVCNRVVNGVRHRYTQQVARPKKSRDKDHVKNLYCPFCKKVVPMKRLGSTKPLVKRRKR